MKQNIHINEDNAHFYRFNQPENMTLEGLHGLVDGYAAYGGVKSVLFCANVQRALFDSKVWEPAYVDYDPEAGPDQPALAGLPEEARGFRYGSHGRQLLHNLWLLKDRGLDHLAIWLARCRHHQMEGWLTMRMNDCHYNDNLKSFWHCSLWREHPEYHRASYRDEGWFETAFDFAHPEVVAHHLALVRELCGRFDFDGLELDWVRWVRNFRPGHDERGAETITQFMRETRKLVDEAGRRQGRELKLGVRLPADLSSCYPLGYDVLSWAAEGLVDQVTLGIFLEQTYFDFDLRTWKRVLGPKVRVLAQVDSAMRSYPASGPKGRCMDFRLSAGSAAAALQRGADGIYLFNECYRSTPGDGFTEKTEGLLPLLFGQLGGVEHLRDDVSRRHALSYAQIRGPGMSHDAVLPVLLTPVEGTYDFGRFRQCITLRIVLGPAPVRAPATLLLGFNAEAGEISCDAIKIWINSREVSGFQVETNAAWSEPVEMETWTWRRGIPLESVRVLSARIPEGLLQDDTNIVEVLPGATAPGALTWAEIRVGETKLPVACQEDVKAA
ncbi:MAG: hypothetical protein HC904_04070 [Blastochloris sp.]|nr:hypothetical protein [Blastochloris sp.]